MKTIEEYFDSCDSTEIQTVGNDMSRAFKYAVQRAFGKTLIIAD